MSTSLEVKVEGEDAIARAFERLASAGDRRRLLDVIGATVESQTRRRLQDEKRDPDGKPWKKWTPEFAERRRSSGGILDMRGDLIDSITYDLGGTREVDVGSNLVYARRHQVGDKSPGVPERAFLGLSDANASEVDEIVGDFLMEAWT